MLKRYIRNIGKITEEQQKALNELKVCVIGCGGIGTIIIEDLVRLGVESITAVDKDVIDETDMNRLIHSNQKTLGLPKAQITKKFIKNINSKININTLTLAYNERTGKKIIKKHDIVIDAVGDFEVKLQIEKDANELEIPHIHTYYSEFCGQVAVLTPDQVRVPEILKRTEVRSKKGGKPIVTASMIGNLTVIELIKFLFDESYTANKLKRYNLYDFKMKEYDLNEKHEA